MKRTPMGRRTAVAALAVFACMGSACAQSWPVRPVKIIAPFPPGGFTDVVTRQVAVRLGAELGQPVIVENRPGAGTNIGTETVVQSPADGYTLLMGTSSLAINPSLYGRLAYDAERDLAPLGVFATTGYTLLANSALPADNVAALVALARAKPDTLSFGSSGNGAVNHLAGALFGSMAGVKLQHVPYKGSQAAITDLVGGQIQLFWASNLEALPMLKAGRVKALGVTTEKPVPAVGAVPPIGRTVQGYEVVYWMGLFAPARTPQAVMDRLAAALEKVSTAEDMQQRLASDGAEGRYLNPAASRSLLQRDTENWRKVVRDAGAKVD